MGGIQSLPFRQYCVGIVGLTVEGSHQLTGGVGVSAVINCDGARVASEDVRAELEHILSNPHFQSSERRRAFLRFIVDETLSGHSENLKGFTIALSVFGRDDRFDPQADPVVRIEARRLRRDLHSYYADVGQNDAVRISVPKGSYVPVFEKHGGGTVSALVPQPKLELRDPLAPQAADPPLRDTANGARSRLISTILRISLVAATTAVGLLAWLGLHWTERSSSGSPRQPAVVVLPFEASSPDENARQLAVGMSQELVSNLFRFTDFRLYTWSLGPERAANESPMQFAQKLGIAYIVNGMVQTGDGEVRVTTTVSNATTREIVWSRTSVRPLDPASLMASQKDLAGEIAAFVGQPYGVIKSDIDTSPIQSKVSNMESYRCVLRAYRYRRSFLRSEFDPAMQCLEETVRRDPEYSDAWAMLGWLHADAGRMGYSGDDNRQGEYDKAFEATSRAVRLQPNNPVALKALAAAYHFMGRYAESDRLTRQAVQLNPNDSDVLAQLGWRLAIRGNFSEGVPLLKRAIERTVNPPGWYFHFIAIDLYLKHDFGQMLAVSERASLSDSGFSQMLIALANTELGNREAAGRSFQKMSQYEPLARDPEGFLRRNGATDQIVDALAAGLQKARAFSTQ
jgi:TolB-like protein